VDSCGCAQYAQPLPAGAEYCNYKKNPNWSKCSDASRIALLDRPLPATSLGSPIPARHGQPAPSTSPATQRAGKGRLCPYRRA